MVSDVDRQAAGAVGQRQVVVEEVVAYVMQPPVPESSPGRPAPRQLAPVVPAPQRLLGAEHPRCPSP